MNSAFILICEGSAGFGGAGVSPAVLRAMKIENRQRDAGATKRTAAAQWVNAIRIARIVVRNEYTV